MVWLTEKPKRVGCVLKRRVIRVDLPVPLGPEMTMGRAEDMGVGAMLQGRWRCALVRGFGVWFMGLMLILRRWQALDSGVRCLRKKACFLSIGGSKGVYWVELLNFWSSPMVLMADRKNLSSGAAFGSSIGTRQ